VIIDGVPNAAGKLSNCSTPIFAIMFYTGNVELPDDVFEMIVRENLFSVSGLGRQVGICVDPVNGAIPIVRTTTQYPKGPRPFPEILRLIIERITTSQVVQEAMQQGVQQGVQEAMQQGVQQGVQDASQNATLDVQTDAMHHMSPIAFNNAMVELYTPSYRKMKWHTDQALDLLSHSYICIFSVYKNPERIEAIHRKLVIKNKKVPKVQTKIILGHNTFVMFSVADNAHHIHKIALGGDNIGSAQESDEWIGITMRVSSTFIKVGDDGVPRFPCGTVLRLASEEEHAAFCHMKGQENEIDGYVYGSLDYTISVSDTMPLRTHTDTDA